MLNTCYRLSKYVFGLRLWELALIGDLGEELPSSGILHNNVEFCQRLHNLVQADYVRMVESLHTGNLPRQKSLRFLIQFGLIQNLYCNFFCKSDEMFNILHTLF